MPNSSFLGSDILPVPRTSRLLDIVPSSDCFTSWFCPVIHYCAMIWKRRILMKIFASVSQIYVQGSPLHLCRGSFPKVSEEIGITCEKRPQPPSSWYEHPGVPPPMPYAPPPWPYWNPRVSDRQHFARALSTISRINSLHHPPSLENWNLRKKSLRNGKLRLMKTSLHWPISLLHSWMRRLCHLLHPWLQFQAVSRPCQENCGLFVNAS